MGAYHIWHPSWVASKPPTLETFVTLGEAFYLARGNADVVRDIARALGIDEAPRSWSFVGGRSHYFTSYFDPGEAWEDRWSMAWRTTAVFAAVHAVKAVPAAGFLDVHLKDPSYFDDGSPDDWPSWPCLIVADFRDKAALDGAHGLLAQPGIVGHTIGKAFDRYPQLRIDFGDRPRAWYEAGAHEAMRLLEALSKAGASVRHDDTRVWLGGA